MCAATASACGANYQSSGYQVDAHIQAELQSSQRVFSPKEFQGSEDQATTVIGSGLTSRINAHVVGNPSIAWDKGRLIDGKLKQYEEIGGEPLTLKTKFGDRISAFHFDVKSFHEALANMGGRLVSLTVAINHPFCEIAQPIKIKRGDAFQTAGVRIPYDPAFESEFKNPKEFLEFCEKRHYQVYWEDSMAPFQVASWWHFNSMKQNLILIPNNEAKQLSRAEGKIEIEKTKDFDSRFIFFKKEPLQTNAIEFSGNIDEVHDLLSKGHGEKRGLKVENSSWNMMRYGGKLYLLANTDVEVALDKASVLRITDLSSFSVTSQTVHKPNLDTQRATIILSMNQLNSFASYSHEVLTFLFKGVNVLAYDNAGKGLSEGKNGQENLTDAIRTCGSYLIQEKKMREDQLIFKGQCAGGVISSVAGQIFPRSHIWVDQSSRTFPSIVEDTLIKRADRAKRENTATWKTSLVPYFAPVAGKTASLVLPDYDVVENLRANQGVQIYTIGVPDKDGVGGDELVPLQDQEDIKREVLRRPGGFFLGINGGTHVTDWWTDPNVEQEVDAVLEGYKLSGDVFPKTPYHPEDFVDRHFEVVYNKKYDPETATSTQKNVYALYEAVMNQNLDQVERIVNWANSVGTVPDGLRDQLSEGSYNYVIHDAINLARELGHKEFAAKLIMLKRNGTI